LINLSRNKLQIYRDESRKAAGKVTGSVGENFGSIQAIKVASAEEDILKHFAKLNDERRRTAVNDTSLAAGLRSTGKIVVSISTGIILLLVGRLMQRGEFTLGDFTLFIFLLNWLTGFIRFLGEFLAWYQRNKISYERMLAIMQGKTDIVPREELLEISPLYITDKYPAIKPLTLKPHEELNLLEVKGLTFTYPNSENGVTDINLTLPKGSFTVIVGRIGSGKTTLLQNLLGLLPAQKGEIYWNGELVTDPSTFFIPPKTAYTSQVPVLFSETVEENITMGLPIETIDIEKATKLAVIDEEIKQMEEEKSTKVGPKGVRLSGGQKHRLAAARMFLREPQLLIFDDLSSALDVKTEEKLWQGLFKNPNVTFLVTSHRKYVLNRADQIIVLKNGKISDVGKIGELLERSEEMQKLWEGKITKIEQPEEIEIRTESHFFNIQDIEDTRRTYPDHLITQLGLKIPKKWSYSSEIHKLFTDLIDLAFEDEQISFDEQLILEQVLSNVHTYSHLLQQALESDIIKEAEIEELEKARKKIYSEAYRVANLDKQITSDELVLLERVLILIKELNYFENN
jgi:ATP-binding cassette subfamily B protein